MGDFSKDWEFLGPKRGFKPADGKRLLSVSKAGSHAQKREFKRQTWKRRNRPIGEFSAKLGIFRWREFPQPMALFRKPEGTDAISETQSQPFPSAGTRSTVQYDGFARPQSHERRRFLPQAGNDQLAGSPIRNGLKRG